MDSPKDLNCHKQASNRPGVFPVKHLSFMFESYVMFVSSCVVTELILQVVGQIVVIYVLLIGTFPGEVLLT